MKRPKLKTKADLESYICDLEIELAYEQKENDRIKEELEQALEVVYQISAGRVMAKKSGSVLEPRFTIENPGGFQ